MSQQAMTIELPEGCSEFCEGSVTIKVELVGKALMIRPQGYGDFSSADGHGVPVYLEYYEGALRLLYWPDINDENPVIVDLEKARESCRPPE